MKILSKYSDHNTMCKLIHTLGGDTGLSSCVQTQHENSHVLFPKYLLQWSSHDLHWPGGTGNTHYSYFKISNTDIDPSTRLNYNISMPNHSNAFVKSRLVTHRWPNPQQPTRFKGKKLMAVSELERRRQYLDLFTPKEKELFLPIVCPCLQNDPNWFET